MYENITQDAYAVFSELIEKAKLSSGDLLVVGCSTSDCRCHLLYKFKQRISLRFKLFTYFHFRSCRIYSCLHDLVNSYSKHRNICLNNKRY